MAMAVNAGCDGRGKVGGGRVLRQRERTLLMNPTIELYAFMNSPVTKLDSARMGPLMVFQTQFRALFKWQSKFHQEPASRRPSEHARGNQTGSEQRAGWRRRAHSRAGGEWRGGDAPRRRLRRSGHTRQERAASPRGSPRARCQIASRPCRRSTRPLRAVGWRLAG